MPLEASECTACMLHGQGVDQAQLKEAKKLILELLHERKPHPLLIRLAWHDAGTYNKVLAPVVMHLLSVDCQFQPPYGVQGLMSRGDAGSPSGLTLCSASWHAAWIPCALCRQVSHAHTLSDCSKAHCAGCGGVATAGRRQRLAALPQGVRARLQRR